MFTDKKIEAKPRCDCDVNQLIQTERAKRIKNPDWWFGLMKFTELTWFVWCEKHRVFLGFEPDFTPPNCEVR